MHLITRLVKRIMRRRIKHYEEVSDFYCPCGNSMRPINWRGKCDKCLREWDVTSQKNMDRIIFWDERPPEEIKKLRRDSLPKSMRYLWDKANNT